PRARGRRADRARDRATRERPRLYPSRASSFVLNASSRRAQVSRRRLLSPAGLTRGSILFVRTFLRTRWIAGSSPAMTSVIAACVCPLPGSPAFAGSPPSPRKGRERVQTEFAARAELRRADS